MSMKSPLTPAGIEPATFRFVAQHFKHCATAVYIKTGQYSRAALLGFELGRCALQPFVLEDTGTPSIYKEDTV